MKLDFNLKLAQTKLGVMFKTPKLIKTAFTHSSYANENHLASNERLEFLGDSILGLVVTEIIYERTNLNEGNLSKLRSLIVSEAPLAKVVDEMGLEELMLKGVGESKNKSSNATKCDLYEAIIGAIYLDLGLASTKKFIKKTLSPTINEVLGLNDLEDSKTRLQETIPHKTIKYFTDQVTSSNIPYFRSVVKINDINCGVGEGPNKRSAEQMAAKEALKKIKEI